MTNTPPPALRHPDEITSASEWRSGSKQGFVIELPSGKKARVKRSLSLMAMLEKGKIPNPLAEVIREQIATRAAQPKISPEDAAEVVPQMMELVTKTVLRNFVEPRVEVRPDDWDEDDDGEWEPSEGAISLDDIDMQDRMFVFAFAQGAALDLEQFRSQQAAAMATVQDGGAVADAALATVVPGGPVPGVLPERGDVPVGSSPGVPDEPSGDGSGQASSEAGSAAGSPPASADAAPAPAQEGRAPAAEEVVVFGP